ncbi:hypothetical protein ACSBR2_001884 [Camellia fascicularis]
MVIVQTEFIMQSTRTKDPEPILEEEYHGKRIMSSRPEFKSSGRRGYYLSNEFSTSNIYSHLAFFLSFLLGVYKASKELLPTKFQRSALRFVEIIKQHKHQLCIKQMLESSKLSCMARETLC